MRAEPVTGNSARIVSSIGVRFYGSIREGPDELSIREALRRYLGVA